jgi:hypothetical protein
VGGGALVVTGGGAVAIAAPLDRMAHAWRVGFERHVA